MPEGYVVTEFPNRFELWFGADFVTCVYKIPYATPHTLDEAQEHFADDIERHINLRRDWESRWDGYKHHDKSIGGKP